MRHVLVRTRTWGHGLLRWQTGHLLSVAGTAAGIAVAVALIASLAGFFAATEARMTDQAVADVAVDWQVQLAPGTDPDAAAAELANSPGYSALVQVGYADTPGFEATTGDTVQTTGPGKVLGLGPGYRDAFPAEIRDLVGSGSVLLAQQTAANLHAAPGTTITIQRPAGLEPVTVTVEGIIDLPLADSLFQTIGAPAGSGPQAPPDNVLLLPLDQWHALFDPVAQIAPDAARIQLHVTLPHNLPTSPTNAFTDVSGRTRNYEERMAGAALVGDNLAARLDIARSDALYARVLFAFLGIPGILLAVLLTVVLVAAGATRRRREQALLRLRGASIGQVLQLAGVEVVLVGLGGGLLGLAIAAFAVRTTFGRWSFGDGTAATLTWTGIALVAALLLAAAALLIPAWRNARETSVFAARTAVRRFRSQWWERIGLDVILLGLAWFVYWRAGRNGYQVVLVPEGVPKTSVSYTSFFAPLLLWAGAALLAVRLLGLLLAGGGRWIRALLRPLGGRLSPLVGASLARQRSRVATGLMLVILAVAFAGSTAIFNATYGTQALVDAELTNGADVTVTGGAAADLAGRLPQIAAQPGVRNAEAMQHRFAYVGADLQDLYGIDAANFGHAARLSDAYFLNTTADGAMAALAGTPDGVLVSPETVFDFQLQLGDTIRIRMQSAADNQYHPVTFHYVGIAREFPTAPSDSFLVANATYVAQQTGSPSVETLLIRTSDSPAIVADRVRGALGGTSGTTVRDIQEQRRVTRSSLTAVSLRGLTRLELGFALALAAAGAGLVLALGLEERRRTLAIATALGAKPRQLGAFVWGEAGLILVGGLFGGGALGWGVAEMLIKLLTQVFDPPPQGPTVPWLYLSLVLVVTVAAVAFAARTMAQLGRRSVLETIRRL